jgi:hypothetical protein
MQTLKPKRPLSTRFSSSPSPPRRSHLGHEDPFPRQGGTAGVGSVKGPSPGRTGTGVTRRNPSLFGYRAIHPVSTFTGRSPRRIRCAPSRQSRTSTIIATSKHRLHVRSRDWRIATGPSTGIKLAERCQPNHRWAKQAIGTQAARPGSRRFNKGWAIILDLPNAVDWLTDHPRCRLTAFQRVRPMLACLLAG